MTRMTSPLAALTAALLLAFALPATAEHHEWDQAAVTALAKQLAEVAGDLRTSVRSAPEMPGRSQRRARFDALDTLRVAQGSINSLVSQLEAGGTQESTYPTYRRIGMLRRDIAQNARRAMITEPTLGKLTKARGILDQMAPFYAGEVAADEEIETGG